MLAQTLQYLTRLESDESEGKKAARFARVYELLPEAQVRAKFVAINFETLYHILRSYRGRRDLRSYKAVLLADPEAQIQERVLHAYDQYRAAVGVDDVGGDDDMDPVPMEVAQVERAAEEAGAEEPVKEALEADVAPAQRATVQSVAVDVVEGAVDVVEGAVEAAVAEVMGTAEVAMATADKSTAKEPGATTEVAVKKAARSKPAKVRRSSQDRAVVEAARQRLREAVFDYSILHLRPGEVPTGTVDTDGVTASVHVARASKWQRSSRFRAQADPTEAGTSEPPRSRARRTKQAPFLTEE